MATEPPTNDALLYPDSTPDPDIKPKIEPTENAPTGEPTPLIIVDPRSLQMPEASVPPQSRNHACSQQGGPFRGVHG
ncbi:hypothetical protein Moror_3627 [Moniliophthora roreri MCA 2997]|uniref:Uncharacterized protein n=1 Tax=Moniliophthora roreri (strain MCA 2997) TaxID=1381753 RepID=V2WE35_MONRO|nr:hypothetical protein Moror_3627 [Moniliophthora roreri MCA 2997]